MPFSCRLPLPSPACLVFRIRRAHVRPLRVGIANLILVTSSAASPHKNHDEPSSWWWWWCVRRGAARGAPTPGATKRRNEEYLLLGPRHGRSLLYNMRYPNSSLLTSTATVVTVAALLRFLQKRARVRAQKSVDRVNSSLRPGQPLVSSSAVPGR
jgi:hypothetical protein